MPSKKYLKFILPVLLSLCLTSMAVAEELTLKSCKEKALAAAKLVEAEGEAAFPKFKDENGPFRWGNGVGYIWVNNEAGVMLMHPIKASLEGKALFDLVDVDGIFFFQGFNEVVEEHGSGWVPYKWPKPGEKTPSHKAGFVTRVEHGGKKYIVGAGMYDRTADDIQKAFPKDAIYEP